MIDISIYSEELRDIEKAIEERTVFTGKVKGLIVVEFNRKTPENFYPLHLNRMLSGIYTSKLGHNEELYEFSFSSSSIFDILCELEYLRRYSRFKNLEIKRLRINIFNIDNVKKFNQNEEKINYLNLIEVELNDIKRCNDLPRFFSGNVNGCYKIIFQNKEELIKEDSYNSLYKILSEVQKIRKEKEEIESIYLELTDLDDSRVIFNERLMAFHESEDIE